MKHLFIIGAALCWVFPAVQIIREHQFCPLVCRVDANGIKGAWYETNFIVQRTLWVSQEQKNLMRAQR
jgi:hypothetical protein